MPIDLYYNESSRAIDGKLEIFFDGPDAEPITITKNDFLVDFTIIEEASAENKNPLGAISANEITITLSNHEGQFSPANTQGIYYGKIKNGLIIKPYIKPNEDAYTEWLQLGKYYVTLWKAETISAFATVTCKDSTKTLMDSPMPDIDVKQDISFSSYFSYLFEAYQQANVHIDDTLITLLPYAFPQDATTRKLFQTLIEATISVLTSDRQGNLTVLHLAKTDPIATLTDDNQIISVDATQTTIKTYNGVKLTYVIPQLTDDTSVLSVKDLDIMPGTQVHNLLTFDKPVFSISGVSLDSISSKIAVIGYSATNAGIFITTTSTETVAVKANLVVTGRNITLVKQELSDNISNMLELYNPFIQNTDYAIAYKAALEKFVSALLPTLKLTIRGNPELKIGDNVLVSSTKYNISFSGIIIRSEMRYDGSLSSDLTLLNAEVVS